MNELRLGAVPPRRTDEIGTLYRALSSRLKAAVRAGVGAPEAAIEDACQVAWSQLLTHHDRVRGESVLPWLTATAVNEVLRALRRERRELPLDPDAPAVEVSASADGPGPDLPARLSALRALPLRQQRLLWLQGLGFSYTEMAEREGCTLRTVERQVLRARQQLRAFAV